MRQYKCLIRNRTQRIATLEDMIAYIVEQRSDKGQFWQIARERELVNNIAKIRREVAQLEKEYFAKCPDKTPQALAAKVENAIKNKFRRKCDSAVARLVSRTLRERQRIGRLISAVEVDEHRCRMVFMECDIAKRHGSVQGYSHKKALAVAQDRVRKITAMPIKMRLTLEKMELKLLRRRIAATHDLA